MPGAIWSAEDKRRLAELVRAGHGPLSIHRQGCFTTNGHGVRSVDAIAQQIRRMHLASPESSERARRAHQRGASVPLEARQKAEEFLRRQGADIPVGVVAEKFGVTISWVRRTLQRLGIRRSWAATVAHPLSRFHDPEYRSMVSRRVKAWAEARSRRVAESLRARRVKLLQDSPRRVQRCCARCRENWPLTPEFFPATLHRASGKTYYLYTCRLCAAEDRRRADPAGDGPRANARTERQRTELQERRQAVQARQKLPEKRCIACWENWPLTTDFWRTTRLQSGSLYFEPRCRLCQNAKRRHDEKARRVRRQMGRG